MVAKISKCETKHCTLLKGHPGKHFNYLKGEIFK